MSGQQPEIKIEIDEETSKGVYTNLAFISHSETEFVVDFTFIQPHAPKTKVLTRIITSPTHAKRFLAALQDNIQKYEARHGTIGGDRQPDPAPKPAQYYQ
jgi:hypothetical protein